MCDVCVMFFVFVDVSLSEVVVDGVDFLLF